MELKKNKKLFTQTTFNFLILNFSLEDLSFDPNLIIFKLQFFPACGKCYIYFSKIEELL